MSMGSVGWKRIVGRLLPVLIGICLWYPRPIDAVEVAPRITDREIIESLSTLKEGQKTLEQRFDSMEKRFDSMEKRFDSMEKRFDKRFDAMEKRFNDQLEVMDRQSEDRFEAMDKRFGDLHWVLGWVLNLLSILIVGVLSILSFVIWDRRTALRPIEKRVDALERAEEQLHHNLESPHEKGSHLTRLLQALREKAKTDPEFATVLRSYSLL
uniref:Uncharacterized protein n=1 Tax=Candidatus Kentrum sp. FW TaxID=2126338 RepID=A0A450T590_9GAMM|nr:MAG: hypothetical protein BECKFW1821B_GA0114236_10684 [Candidatus Kentron sp. FW]